MRKPRDIDAQLKALHEKAKTLKTRRVTQLGELVAATGADGLDVEVLAGALLAAVEGAQQDDKKEAWRRRGAAFFQRGPAGKSESSADGFSRSVSSDRDGAAAG